jgi:hypothetical protein
MPLFAAKYGPSLQSAQARASGRLPTTAVQERREGNARAGVLQRHRQKGQQPACVVTARVPILFGRKLSRGENDEAWVRGDVRESG